MGKLGRGRGGLAPEEESPVDFKIERGKVHTGKGAVIGQFQVEGEQIPGEATSSLAEVVEAAERDASDRIQRDRIPRQYQKAIKTYFANARKKADGAKPEGSKDEPATEKAKVDPNPTPDEAPSKPE